MSSFKNNFKGNILVAEDCPTNQMLFRIMLTKLGFKVDLADDGLQAVEKAANNNYKLIFMDMQMPNMDGYDATQKIKEMGVETPVIALTAHAMFDDKKKCLDAGCDDYLSKPVMKESLIDMIESWLLSSSKDGNY